MKPTQKIIWTSLLFLLLIVFLGAMALLPLLQGIMKDSASLLRQKQEIASVAFVEQSVEEFQEFSRLHGQDFAKAENLFSDPETPIPFIEFVEGIARESGFELKIIPSNPKKLKGDPWPSMTFQLSSAGSYSNIFLFLKKLEQAPFLLEVQQVMFSQKRGLLQIETQEPQMYTVSFSIVVKVYTKALPEEANDISFYETQET